MMDKKLAFRPVRRLERMFYGAFVPTLALLVTLATAQEAWYNKGWVYRRQINVSSNMVYGDQNLTHFPVLVHLLSDGGLAIKAQDDGDDILFTDSDGTTQLPHEIERFDSDTGELVAWVNVPTLSYRANTTIYMYYGNPSAEDQQNVTGVWSDGYAKVYHMHDYQERAGRRYIKESVSNTYEAEIEGDADTTAAGKIARAVRFDGSGDWIDTNYGPNYGTGDFTIELWYYEDSFDSGEQYMAGSVKDQSAVAVSQGRVGGDALKWLLRDVDGNESSAERPGTFFDAWHYVAIRRSGANLDGVMDDGKYTGTGFSGSINLDGNGFSIGALNTDGSRRDYFDGRIDEVRFSKVNVLRSDGWIWTTYNNVRSPSSYINVGEETPAYAGITPKSALWTTDPQYVFCSDVLHPTATAKVKIVVKDEDGEPVPAGMPIYVRITRGYFTGGGLFYTYADTTSKMGGGEFYFRTGEGGVIHTTYHAPQYTPPPFTSWRSGRDMTEEEAWKKYQDTFGLKVNIYQVFFRSDGAPYPYNYGPIALEPGSTIPLLVSPDRAKINTVGVQGDRYVFSSEGLIPAETASVTIQVWDSRGRPVPKGTPIAIGFRYGYLTGSGLFHSSGFDSTSKRGGGTFFFKAEDNGMIKAIYHAPQRTLWPSLTAWWGSNSQRYPGKTPLEAYVQKYPEKEAFTGIWPVTFGGLSPSAYSYYGGLSTDPASTTPYLIGIDNVKVMTVGAHGDRYVFSAEGVPPETASVTIQVFDYLSRPVPKGTPIGVGIRRGYLIGDGLFYSNVRSSKRGGGDFYFRVGDSGTIRATYYAPQLLPMEYSYWYSQYKDSWEEYMRKHPGYNPFYSDAAYSMRGFWGVIFGTTPMMYSYASIPIDTSSITPYLVGPDAVEMTTVGVHGDDKVFSNSTRVERAKVTIQAFDNLGRPVPPGTPFFIESARGRLYSPAISLKSTSPGIGNDDIYFFRVGEDGKAEFIYEPEYRDVFPLSQYSGSYDYWLRNYGLGFTGYYDYGTPAKVWDVSYAYDDTSFVRPHAHIIESLGGPMISVLPGGTYPILVGPDRATVKFIPRELGPGKNSAVVTVKLFDTEGRPVPHGTVVGLALSYGSAGSLKDPLSAGYAKAIVKRSIGNEVVAVYFSPTRRVGSDFTDKVNIYVPGYDAVIGSSQIRLYGSAYSPADPSIVKMFIGISGEELFDAVVSPIRDLVVLPFEFQNLALKAQVAGDRWRNLQRRIAKGDLRGLEAGMQEFRQNFIEISRMIGKFIKTMPGTSFQGPPVGPTFDPIPSFIDSYEYIASRGVVRRFYELSRQQLAGKFVKDEMKNAVEEYLKTKSIAGEESGSGNPKISFKAGKIAVFDSTFVFPAVDSIEVGQIYILNGGGNMYDLFSFKFHVRGTGGLVKRGIVKVNDKFPIPENILPDETFNSVMLIGGSLSLGMAGVMSVDTTLDAFEGIVVGISFPNPSENPVVPFVAEVEPSGGELFSYDGSRVNVPSGAVSDHTTLFFMRTPPPYHFSEEDTLLIVSAYTLGYIRSDTTLADYQFSVPVELSLVTPEVDSVLFGGMKPELFVLDPDQERWIPMEEAKGASPDTVQFVVSSTGIFGLGGKAAVSSEVSVKEEVSEHLPLSFHLYNNFPNPFNAITVIRYTLPEPSEVLLTIYDVLGRKVGTLVEGHQQPGMYRAVWDGRDDRGRSVGSGVYLYKLRAGGNVKVRRMVLLR